MKASDPSRRRARNRGAVVLCLALAMSACGCAPPGARRRSGMRGNILLIIADDVGKDKIGVYQQGDDATRPATPNIDRLAARGVRFTNAYSYTACSPTRATILTGRYGFRTGVGTVIQYRTDPVGLPQNEISLPEMLELGNAGYDHSQVGKWHLGVRRDHGRIDPLRQGFNWSAGPMPLRSYFAWSKLVSGKLIRSSGYVTSDTTDDAIARANAMHEPWLLWVAYNAAHKPYHLPPRELHHQVNPGDDVVRLFAAMVESLDTEIGRLLSSIEPSVLANTTIIFLGDNGTPSQVIPASHKRPAKGSLYEAGINIPMLVAGPVIPDDRRGRVCEALVNTTDIYATVADIAGVDLAGTLPAGHVLDSFSMLPALKDPAAAAPIRRFAYAERFKPNGPAPHTMRQEAIRDKRWKLLRIHQPARTPPHFDRLFDLAAAEDGGDGKDLGPAPGVLSGDSLAAYHRLAHELDLLNEPPDTQPPP